MDKREQARLIQNYLGLMGKIYVILLKTLDEYFGAPLSTNEKMVLIVLDKEPISITEISQRTGLLLTTLTNVLDKMEEKRLVRRKPSSKDRRVVEVDLAVAGRQVMSRFDAFLGQISFIFIDFLPGATRAEFTKILLEIVQILGDKTGSLQETLGTLLEPLKETLAKQFKHDE
jgi:DNA-binding MarR family transcriptional regulator